MSFCQISLWIQVTNKNKYNEQLAKAKINLFNSTHLKMSAYYYLQSSYEQPALQYVQSAPALQYASSIALCKFCYKGWLLKLLVFQFEFFLANGEIAWGQSSALVAAAPVVQQAVAVAPVQQAVAVAQPTTFVKDVVTNVNRHHYHTKRVITRDNNFNTYVTNHITKVNDIHHYRVENVKGETRTFNDYKQTQTVEPATCNRA